jgi:CBS-domain-containing membrane protein
MKHNPRLNELVRKIRAQEEYAKPRKEMDINSSMRIVEHARLELETYSLNTSTMLSALAGAIIGSILTLVATYFLGTRPYVPSPIGNSTQTLFINVAYAFLSSILMTNAC